MPANAGIHVFLAASQKAILWMAGTKPGHDGVLVASKASNLRACLASVSRAQAEIATQRSAYPHCSRQRGCASAAGSALDDHPPVASPHARPYSPPHHGA